MKGFLALQFIPHKAMLEGWWGFVLLISFEVMLFSTDVYDFFYMLEFLDTTLIPPRLTDPGRLLSED